MASKWPIGFSYFSMNYQMIPERKLKISFHEMAEKGARILAKRPKTTFEEAYKQVQRLKQASKVNSASKKSRPIS